LLAAIQNAAHLIEQVRHFEWRLAGDCVAIPHAGCSGGSKRYRQILVAQQTLGFDGGHGVLFDDLAGRFVQIHDYRDLVAGFVGQHDGVHSSHVNPAHPHISSRIQTYDVVELRPQSVGRAEKILLATDDEDTSHQNCQGSNDESS